MLRPTFPVRMARMRFWASHMLDPDCPLLDMQVWPMMLAHACTCKLLTEDPKRSAFNQPFSP